MEGPQVAPARPVLPPAAPEARNLSENFELRLSDGNGDDWELIGDLYEEARSFLDGQASGQGPSVRSHAGCRMHALRTCASIGHRDRWDSLINACLIPSAA